ncbi:endonuclease/exonuclease/phosphatase family protein [Odoribacter lunatus]|uniref:endonuclease/exonuclease/phosphatase family protein n=1 Tax=Odoribacter lunatus TaxID=2941335 RepID=UPI00203F7916|nr:endonuclease/exonuclease/phosphatase family protein [Odoribacter lunatus]
MLRRCILIGSIGWCLLSSVLAQERYRVVSYNVENLFDTRHDIGKRDEEFTPEGRLHWTQSRYTEKLQKISRAIYASGEGQMPTFVGLCEIENRRVLDDLTTKTVLAEADYGIAHRESSDRRGIDVAFLYKRACFRILRENVIPVKSEQDTTFRTREILYVSGILTTPDSLRRDTFHFFVCHFPSMAGGESQSEWKRKLAASSLKNCIDSIQRQNPKAAIILMGDFNGKADRPALKTVLKAKRSDARKIENTGLYNTGYYLLYGTHGSYKYKGEWQTIDHIIVSGILLNGKHMFQAEKHLTPYAAKFLLEEDSSYFGYKPWRTFVGPRYVGGYSDHLPIYLDLH